MSKLTVSAASGLVLVHELGGDVITIGRGPDNVIQIDDPSVSGEHAEISLRRGRWWVRDLGSTNGTLVNGTRITSPTPLISGATVQFGRVSGRFNV